MRVALLAALVVILAACVKNAGKVPVTTCTVKPGEVLQVGDQGPAVDGCNTCVCQADFTLLCTARPCNDAGPGEGEGEGEGEGQRADAGVVDEGPCHDEDGDGFYSCLDPNHPERPQLVDCDDTRWWVQPGPDAIEFPDTPEDDNCNGTNDDWITCDCTGVSTSATDLGSAMDLCGPQVVSGTLVDGKAVQYGNVDAYSGVIGPRLRTRIDDPNQPPIIIGNQCLTTLSNGDATGNAALDPAIHGLAVSSCNPGVCPTGSHCGDDSACAFADPDPDHADPNPVIRDLAQIHYSLKAPSNAAGFAFDFMFMSQEWPEFLCQEFNDTFYAIVENDSAVHDGHAVNTAFDSAGRPITVNVGFFENPAVWTIDLTGTPYGASSSHCGLSGSQCTTNADCPGDTCISDQCAVPCTAADGCPGTCTEPAYCSDGTLESKLGSGSGWLTTSVPVTPGQPFDLTLSIHDEGDQIYDSLVLLDNFRWLPQAPTLQTVKGGG
jgi:hypothetical protein